MAATYDPLLPTDRDVIRFKLGDTESANPLLSDEQIDAMILRMCDWRLAGAELADGLATKAAQDPDSVAVSGTITVSWRSLVPRWVAVAAQLRAEAAQDTRASSPSGFQSFAALRDEPVVGEYRR